MNETRKQIINLIQDYMDKTLSFGVMLEDPANQIMTFVCKSDNNKILEGFYYENNYGGISIDCGYKILGHYDITSVLKYIQHTKPIYTIEYEATSFMIIDYYNSTNRCDNCDREYDGELKGTILNKPLHLYTEQEEKELLELLLKLKN